MQIKIRLHPTSTDLAQTRQKLKEAYDIHFAATIERAEKQIILAKYGRRLLNYLDDAPVVPGDERQPFAHANEARQVLNDAEQELQAWQPHLEPIHSSAGNLGSNLMPSDERENLRSPASAKSSEFHEDATTLHHHHQAEDISAAAGEPGTESKRGSEPVLSS
jgi:Eisosome component PIL1